MLCCICIEVLNYNLVMEVAHWKIVGVIVVCGQAKAIITMEVEYLLILMCLLKPSAAEASQVWCSMLDAFEAGKLNLLIKEFSY